MPQRPHHPCPGCGELTRKARCPACKRARSAHARGYTRQWQKARIAYLAEHPLCVDCREEGRVTPATVVDHIVPHKGNDRLFWDEANNWAARCKSHHDAKTAREDGGFGNR